MRKKVTTTIRVPVELLREFDIAWQSDGKKSRNEAIIEAIEDYITRVKTRSQVVRTVRSERLVVYVPG